MTHTEDQFRDRICSSRSQRAALSVALACCSAACLPQAPTKQVRREQKPAVVLELSHGVPIARDDAGQALLRVDVFEGDRARIAVPYLFGYPLYSEQGGLGSLRKLRHENWDGYERSERREDDGVVHVRERFPALGCTFEGVQESRQHYVPLLVRCELPVPEARGGSARAVIGAVKPGASPKAVREEPSLARAFLGDFHVVTPGFDEKSGTAYFATADGLLGFGFERGGLTSVSFLFDPPHKAWRSPEAWAARGD